MKRHSGTQGGTPRFRQKTRQLPEIPDHGRSAALPPRVPDMAHLGQGIQQITPVPCLIYLITSGQIRNTVMVGLLDRFKQDEMGGVEEMPREGTVENAGTIPESAPPDSPQQAAPESPGIGIDALMNKRVKLEEAIDYVGLMIRNLKEKRTNLEKEIEDESVDIKNLREKADQGKGVYRRGEQGYPEPCPEENPGRGRGRRGRQHYRGLEKQAGRN